MNNIVKDILTGFTAVFVLFGLLTLAYLVNMILGKQETSLLTSLYIIAVVYVIGKVTNFTIGKLNGKSK